MSIWRNDFIQKNKYTRPAIKLKQIKKIVLHWTANPGASAENHQKYFNGTAIKNKTYASAHIFVDSKEAICIIPLDEIAYHANDTQERNDKGESYRGVKELLPNANKLSIGVEMCLEKDGTISPITIQKTIEVITELCKTFKLTEKDIVRHYDVTHKQCPKPFVDHPEQFELFKQQVGQKLNPPPPKPSVPKPVPPKQEAPKPTPTKPSTPPLPVPIKTLKLGSKGNEVKQLQTILTKLNLVVKIDGDFGNNTKLALIKLQKSNKLVADGIYGKATQQLVQKLLKK